MAHIVNALEGYAIPTIEGIKIYLNGVWSLIGQYGSLTPTTIPRGEDMIHPASLTLH